MATINEATLDQRIRELEAELASLRKMRRVRELERAIEQERTTPDRLLPPDIWPNGPWTPRPRTSGTGLASSRFTNDNSSIPVGNTRSVDVSLTEEYKG